MQNKHRLAYVAHLWHLIKACVARRKRVATLAKVWINYGVASITHRSCLNTLPYAIAIEPTALCNLACPECPTGRKEGKRTRGAMGLSLFKKVIDEVQPHAFYLTLYFQGEPLLNPDFCEMVRYAKQHQFYVCTSTNAHLLTAEMAENIVASGIDKVIVSLDGATQESYAIYRKNGNLQQVLKGIQNLVEAKNKQVTYMPYIEVQTIVFSFNEHELSILKELSNTLGADAFVIKTAQLYNYQSGHSLMPKSSRYSRYVAQADGTYRLKKRQRNRCLRCMNTAVVTWDGLLLPCCFDKDTRYAYGSIAHQSFAAVYTNAQARTFRQQVFQHRNAIEICTNCSE